jgi:Ca2+-binding EF-hand superfamily protein
MEEQALTVVFNVLDRDGSGELSKVELRQAIEDLDADEDGAVTFDDFRSILKHSHSGSESDDDGASRKLIEEAG